ncbi:hypothetical protein HDU67_003954 [Dinochytrium kinnereticum]|nr:hypothetical protein HDU67_003954 [Dinochytrium kinnereticum]
MSRNRTAKMNIAASEFVPSGSIGGSGSNNNSGSNGSLSRSNGRRSSIQSQSSSASYSKHNNSSGQHAQQSQPRRRRQSQREKKASRHNNETPSIAANDYEIVGLGLANKRGEISLNHLLNFSFPAREPQTGLSTPLKKKGVIYQPFMKERFINANYRFIMNPEGDYTVNLFDSDIIVEWNDILQVVTGSSCEDISLSDLPDRTDGASLDNSSKWAKCPLCHDAVYGKDLKSARFVLVESMSRISPVEPRSVPMTLVKRAINSSLALPRATYCDWNPHPKSVSHTAAPSVDNTSFIPFSKLMLATDSYLRNYILEPDRRDLGVALNEALHEESMLKALGGGRTKAAMESGLASSGSERPFIEMALAEVKAKLAKIPNSTPYITSDTIADRRMPASPDEYGMIPREPEDISLSVVASAELTSEPKENSVNPDRSKSRQSGPPSDGFYYFYQASDGQHIYMHPLEIKMLKHEFVEYDKFPDHIIAKALTIQESTMNEELKKKCKYLSHVPLSCDISFCELDLTGVVSTATMTFFEKELSQRSKKYQQMERELREEAEKKKTDISGSLLSSSPSSSFMNRSDMTRDEITSSWEDPTLFDTLWPAAKPISSPYPIQGSSLAGPNSSDDEGASAHSVSPPRQDQARAAVPLASFATMAAKSSNGSPLPNAWSSRAIKPPSSAVRRNNRLLVGADSDEEAFGYMVDDELGWALDLEEALETSGGGSNSVGKGPAIVTSTPASGTASGSGGKKGGKKVLLVSNGGRRRY